MVLMLLSTAPLAGYSGYGSSSGVSSCSNPFSSSFTAFLRPVFNVEDDVQDCASESCTTTKTPTLTHPWIKPSPIRIPPKKALPPLPALSVDSPSSPIIRESELVPGTAVRPTLKASFTTRVARRSRYDSVPEIHTQQSPEETDTPSNENVPLQRGKSQEEDVKLDMSIALAGVELNISFTPNLANPVHRRGNFSSSVSSMFDSPGEPLKLGAPQSNPDGEVTEEDSTMVVPLAIEVVNSSLPRVGDEAVSRQLARRA